MKISDIQQIVAWIWLAGEDRRSFVLDICSSSHQTLNTTFTVLRREQHLYEMNF